MDVDVSQSKQGPIDLDQSSLHLNESKQGFMRLEGFVHLFECKRLKANMFQLVTNSSMGLKVNMV
jgi:hypothetical protein